jgi:DegV family protein with EDD domain
MRKTAIVMDSTGYLTPDIIDEYDIRIVSLNVNIGEETFPEIQLTNRDLFTKLKKISGTSTTSQPSVGAFLEVYQTLIQSGYEEIVSIHLSQKISGTFSSAQMAKDLMPEANIVIFDSGSAATGLGLLTWAAAEWANLGLTAAEIKTRLETLKEKTELYFTVDTLEYLQRGGRIGGAAALFGTLLQIKPILYINSDGVIDVFDKVRSKGRAWQRTLSELKRALASGKPHRIGVIHVEVPEEAKTIVEELKRDYPGNEIQVYEAGPVIATHVGPGTLGLSFHPWPLD